MTDLSGVSTEDLMAYKSGDLSKVSTNGLMALRGISSQQPSAPSDPNYFQRVAQDWKDNYAAGQATTARTTLLGGLAPNAQPTDINPIHAAFQNLGQGPIGYLAAPVKEAIGSAISMVPTTPDVKNTLAGLGQHVQTYLADKPNLAADLHSLGNIAAVTPMFDGASSNLAASGANASKYAYSSPQPNTAWQGTIPSSESIHAEAQKGYDFADTSGTGVNAQGAENYFNQAKTGAAQSPTDLLRNGPDEVQKYLDNMDNAKGQPISIGDAQQEDIKLRESASKAYRAGDNSLGQRWDDIRTALHDHIYNQTDPSLMTGGPQGFQALQEANRLKSQAYTVEKVENAINDGLKAEVPQTGIKQNFKTMAKDIAKNGPKGLSQDTVDAINYAGTTGILTGTLKTMGSKLGAAAGGAIGGGAGVAAGSIFGPVGSVIGGAVGGTVGTGVGLAVGAPFRAGAKAIQLGKANDVLRTIIDNPTFTPPSLSDVMPTSKPLMLPAPETEYAADAHGNIRALSPEEKVAAQSNRQAASDLGLTQDVSANIYRNNLRAKVGPAWDSLEQSQQSKIASDIKNAWKQNPATPISDLIASAKQSADELAAAKGQSGGIGSFGQALLNAKK